MLLKIIIGLVVFSLSSIVAYLFRMRQLYTVVPKLYRTSFLSEKGSVSELIIYNRGNKTEEDIVLEIDQEMKCELLGANSSDIKLVGNTVQLTRLHAKNEASLILLVENGILTDEKLTSLSSKDCKGKIYKKTDEVPPSSSHVALSIIGLIAIISVFTWGPTFYNYLNNKWISYKYSYVVEKGWKGIDKYLSSDFMDSYSDQEFPLRFIGYKRVGKIINISYEAINKSALPISVFIKSNTDYSKNEDESYWWFSGKKIQPLSKEIITVKGLRPKIGIVKPKFNIRYGDEFIYGITNTVTVED